MKICLAAACAAMLAVALGASVIRDAAAAPGSSYAVVRLDGSVNPISAGHIVRAIERANAERAQFIVLQMDTPGGMVSSTDDIIKAIYASGIPVVVYAYPKGGEAFSAGAYIMLAAHVAVMAPLTKIGAMHPVALNLFGGGGDGEKNDNVRVMGEKMLNAMLVGARSSAHKRGRNLAWVERAVTKSITATSEEAVGLRIIDFLADDYPDLLKRLDGRTVRLDTGATVVLRTAGSQPIAHEMNWKERFFNFFADPQVVYFLIIIALVGIGIEIKNPGLIVPGVVGILALLFFLLAMRILPVNFFGVILIMLAIVLFVLELKFTSYGLLSVGGIISFVVGSMMLFDSPLPGFSVPLPTIIGVALFVLFLVFVVVRSIVKA
ncbi:MAG TPA: ATP-dependent Clp protease proteolytic subunit, partial [Spirochaetota bacterium]|nr:ATP-dependent Clp protease proteolytic subunit [Spirochaetota bacterium]